MATYGYTAPGVRIRETSVPTVAPIFERPTNIAIVGEALGYEEVRNEIVFLEDNDAVTLKVPGVNLNTIVVKDSYDTNLTYAPATDYTIGFDGDFVTLRRNVYSQIESGEALVVVLTTAADPSKTRSIGDGQAEEFSVVGLTSTTAYAPTADDIENIIVQRVGAFNIPNDYDIDVSGTTVAKIRRKAGTPRIQDGQIVYVSYTTNSGANTYTDQQFTLLGNTYSGNFSAVAEGVDPASIVVRNTEDMSNSNTAVFVFAAGASSDYAAIFDNAATPTPTVTISRSIGPTTIGASENRRTVKVSYRATSPSYYMPRRCFSFSEVESRFGKAIDMSSGTIVSPLTFGAYMAFANGASDIVCQALYHTGDPGDSQAPRLAPSNKTTDVQSYVADWLSAFRSLRDYPEINVIVPIVGQDASLTDANVKTVFQSLQDHINFQAENDEHIICLLGEDSTAVVGRASLSALQSHAQSLGTHNMAERTALISPAGYAFSNSSLPRGYQPIGGQYVAAALAGQLAQRPIQDALTRKSIVGVADVLDYRSKEDKNNDGQSGLLVIERRNNAIVVRHAVTTAITNINSQELSVVRAKLYMMESLRRTLDTRIVGQIPADDIAPTVVGATVQSVLETLMQSGAIIAYSALQVRSLGPTLPSTIEVRFNYKPSYPLNYIEISFSIDVNTGANTTFGV